MKRNRFFTAIGLITAVWFSACTNDEPMDPNTLPEGKYPLEIASVTMSVESSSKPWSTNAPQTRVTESDTDDKSSVWEWDDTERIGVQLYADDDDNVATYTLNADKTLTSDKTLYWKNKEQTTVMAWYPAYEGESGTVSLADQSGKLAYVLKGSGTGNYNTPVVLSFEHALAKIRVKLMGNKADKVTDVKIKSFTSCTHTNGTDIQGNDEGWITMQYVAEKGYWEANVVPDKEITQFLINEITEGTLNNGGIIPEKAKVNTITINVKSVVPEDAKGITGNISDNGNYVVRGTRNEAINITSGSPHIYLDGATINVSSGNAINITGGNPTIHVVGTENSVTSGNGAGIFVAENSTVTITGDSRDDKLTVRTNGDAAAIGGYATATDSYQSCGAINISNITVEAYGGYDHTCSPGIGSVGDANSQTITIDNAVVYAFGTVAVDVQAAPAIGCGHPFSGAPDNIPTIVIKNESIIHAHRGNSLTDYIGWAGNAWNSTAANSTINLGGGTCTNSTVYCYTSDTLDKTVVYDGSGVETEQQ